MNKQREAERKAITDFCSRAEVLITSDGETHVFHREPPARKPLTDEQISAVVQSMSAYTWDAHMLARAIERAHGIGEP